MSLQTWREEFYPREACDVPEEEALAHSIRKWEGLQADALARHELTSQWGEIEDGDESLRVGSRTCALCRFYISDGFSYGENYDEDKEKCEECPLFKIRGGVPCDEEMEDEETSPWGQFSGSVPNAVPMLMWLRKAQETGGAK